MQLSQLTAISPLDGRYGNKTEALREIFSEYALMHNRVIVEIAWLKQLAAIPQLSQLPPLTEHTDAFLDRIIANFSLEDAKRIKAIEATTNHDVKAVEYFLKDIFQRHDELKDYREFVHFACTSEDINNLAYGLMLKKSRDELLLPQLNDIITLVTNFSLDSAAQPLLSRTHGQAATPTTMGKEMANFVYRLQRLYQQIHNSQLLGKINGAVGNFNAHHITYPDIDWLNISETFVTHLGLTWNPYTTQIEPHDYVAQLFSAITHVNNALIDLCRDIWGYISLHYLQQKPVAGEVGSSTMPHKINPIDFENAEGNLGFANAIFTFLSNRLPISRWQRDLVDSTLLRNMGVAVGHSMVAYSSLIKGLNKLTLAEETINQDLDNHWEIVAEAIQTIMRRYGVETPYEQLKALTRGKKVTKEAIHAFVDSLPLDDEIIAELKQITPANYTGIAARMAKDIRQFCK